MTMTMELDYNNTHKNTMMGGALFTVIFFDGEREIDLGNVLITPSMNFKAFQSLISQKIGISPHQITTYFTPFQTHNTHHHRRRPVTSKFDFAAALPESTSSFFWVVLKRSRRVRRRRPKNEQQVQEMGMENFVLLRRNPNLDYMELMEKERYLMSLNLNSNVYSDLSSGLGYGGGGYMGGSDDGGSSSSDHHNRVVYCDVCWNAQILGKTVPFHWCKNDAVTKVFRSPAGPIAPPLKNNNLG